MVDIRVSPEQLRTTAGTLETQRGEADGMLSKVLQTVNDLSGDWSGLAQVDYASRVNENVPRMQANLNELLEELIRELRRIADVFEETDRAVV